MKRFVASSLQRGFTLVEMMVIAPIVILLIGAFIALIINLTGEVMSSRGSNVLAYDVQDALNRIEEDVKLSTGFLAVNNIDISGTLQGYGGSTTTGSNINFTSVDKSGTGGSTRALILNALVTNANPTSQTAGLVYLANSPNSCDEIETYSKNTPMSMNIVYFVDESNTLWRRTILPPGYDNAANRCGPAPWQQPSCINGYNPASLPACRTNDIKLAEGVSPSGFTTAYFNAASTTAADPVATTATDDAARTAALQGTPTLSVSITAEKTIAGREITSAGSLRVSRLDTNASSIAVVAPPTAAPAQPIVSNVVSDGHRVNFTWPRVATATSYDIDYRINGAAWQTGAVDADNNSRSYEVVEGTHTDTVEVRVRAKNSFDSSAYTLNSVTIPLWAPILLKGNWTDYASTYSTAAYTKTKAGLVLFKGLVKNSGSPVNNEILGTIPYDYRPTGRLMFGTSTNSNVSARVDVGATGEDTNIYFQDGGSGPWYSLESVRYIAAEESYTRTLPTLLNGFSNYGGSYAPASYVQDSTGRVSIQGLLANGTRTNGTTIFNIPANLRPAKYQHHSSRSGTFHHLGIDATSGLLAKGDGTGAYSINVSYLPSTYPGTWTGLTLVNGWAWYDASSGMFSTPEYTKTSDNVVHLKGLIRSGSTTYDTVIATLPAGFRPKARILTTTTNTSVYSRVDILPDGQVRFMGSTNNWFSLDTISFVAEQ